MDYELTINEANKQPHVDIEKDIAKIKRGVFTFTIKINKGDIVDYNVTEYVDASRYLRVKSISIEEHTTTLNHSKRSEPNAIRPNNIQR